MLIDRDLFQNHVIKARESSVMLIMKKLGAFLKNYLRIERWILIERDLTENIEEVRSKIPCEIQYDALETTLSYIRQIFYENGFDEGEKREIELAKQFDHLFPNIAHDGKIVAFQKVGRGRVYVRSLRKVLGFPSDTLFTYSLYTAPQFRGQKLASYLMTQTLKVGRNKGFLYVRGQINPKNRAAIKLHNDCGFYEAARFWHIRVLHWDCVTADMGQAKVLKRIPLGLQ